MAATSSRCKDPVFHWIVSWATGETPTHDEIRDICETLLADLGLAESQYVAVIHGDTDNLHAHIVANRVADGRAAPMTKSVIAATKSMARQALERGYDIVKSPHVEPEARDQAKRRGMTGAQFDEYWASPSPTLRDWAAQKPGEPHLTAREKAQIDKGQVPFRVEFQEALTSAFASSDSWTAFEKACAESGLCLLVEAKKGATTGKIFPGVRFRTTDSSRGESGSKVGLPYRMLSERFGPHSTERAAAETMLSPAPEEDAEPKVRLTPAEGRLLAALVRKRRLDTYVEYYCASACTQVFVAGRDRAIGQDAQLGFHQAVVVDKDGQAKRVRRATERTLSPLLVFGVNGNDTLRLAYEQAGIDEGFIARVLAQPHSDMWTPTVAELQAAKVVTRLAAPGEVPLPPGGTGQAEVSARLAAKPLWRESARAYPADYGRAVGEVWRWANSGIPLDAAIGTARLRLVEALTPRLLAASDIQLEGLLAFRVRTAREQRETGYPLCGKDWLVDARATDPRMAAIEDEEDRLLAAILASPPAVTPPSREVAMNTFASEVMPVFAKAYRRGDAENGQGACRYTYRIFETIAELPDGKRIRAYRAMLALPKFLP